ncbi:MerR family transcriptional regulator [Streptomyces purpurogeneiscleroticus]|uniref:MerR family transcriptional regulator n=1 Tax=Streptomyces purpurogeneiscleroticus TaxID=68259 RepID=UPI001CBDCEB1|nr:MerR family transcriptional regulator [Streptomyces purpurogeneiscleroticus]MBZ4020022.1 MerR family transcriptional regulator [Streptomyces purpurogeneiscleroticus]
MRIGELAALAGVTTRTVRHYHHLGLLPEPERRANGYREYALRDAVLLTRVRRLTELGLGLDEVRDVLAEDARRDLEEVLAELDADLARQEAELRERRARLRTLLDRAKEHGGLPAEGPVSEELADVFGKMARASAARPGPEPAMAAKEREMMALFESMGGDEARERLSSLLGSALLEPAAMDRAYEVYALLDELAEAEVDDPRVARAAQAIIDCLPDAVAAELGAGAQEALAGPGSGDAAADRSWMAAFYAHFAPAQAAAVQQTIRLLAERAR